jgi:(2Fe-2S) ferredoxin
LAAFVVNPLPGSHGMWNMPMAPTVDERPMAAPATGLSEHLVATTNQWNAYALRDAAWYRLIHLQKIHRILQRMRLALRPVHEPIARRRLRPPECLLLSSKIL